MARPRARRTDLAMSFDVAQTLDIEIERGKIILLLFWELETVVVSVVSAEICGASFTF